MADSQYPYPPDRFDDEADAVSFHGAHRAELPFWRENLLYIIIIGAAAVLLVVLLFFIGSMGGDGDERAEDPTTAAESTTEGETSAEEEGEASEEPAPEADMSTPVLVVNAGGINGLAGSWRDTLEGDGWEDVSVATADSTQQEPAVFYRAEEDAETAQALAAEVGAAEAQQSDEYDAAVTFVAVTEPGAGGEDSEG
ncbi:LytR C-terminal domain-containing protein [Brachybacterium saurashtrense]|uniref:LytR family transcriptional regulator n=1 Tax=Brachybacterium saurashtrense TaxID=556288 RepID=A0A345YKA4_9MICO|nr:LytR C-terminal domain-containing protein [Brachybacterium saurashtrense]AXK44356.1 LytR family transcriptional regulator [Brachybacterium saurashtrense]RRR21298.1 LytR family transcriptional regulator [Brachybacterium saurashtrense]RRR22967.1 LytR family transcriptional regulator [Brachybacterium saurashtrense]